MLVSERLGLFGLAEPEYGFALRFGEEPVALPELCAAGLWAANGTKVGPLRNALEFPVKVGADGVNRTEVLRGAVAATAAGIEIPLRMRVDNTAKVERVILE